MPSALARAIEGPRFNWQYQTEPEPHPNDRTIEYPRGRVLGGSSSINGMMYIRGHARDYDRWAQSGCRGWSYSDVLPYFKRAEANALDVGLMQACKQPVSLHGRMNSFGKLGMGPRWFLFHDGLGATNHYEAGSFIRSRAGIEHPDLRLTLAPFG